MPSPVRAGSWRRGMQRPELLRLEVLLGERPRAALEQALAPILGGDERGCLRRPRRARSARRCGMSARWPRGGSGGVLAHEPTPGRFLARSSVGARPRRRNAAAARRASGCPVLDRDARRVPWPHSAGAALAALRAAGGYLAVHWSPELVQGGSWHAICGYAHFFSNVPHEISDAVLQWCGRELERAFRIGAFDAVRAARIFTLCDAHALPGAKLDGDGARTGAPARRSPPTEAGPQPRPPCASRTR